MTQWLDEKGEARNHSSCDSFVSLDFSLSFFFIQKQHQPTGAESSRELTVCAMVLAYVSAIQDISRSPVLMSGAGTSMPGPGQEREGLETEWFTQRHTEHSLHNLIYLLLMLHELLVM